MVVMKFKLILNTTLFTVFSIIVIIACDDTTGVQDLDSRIIPDANVSYSQHIQPVFDLKCNNKDCHNAQDVRSGLSLASHGSTTASFLIVAPGNPNNSKLVWVVEGKSASPMPPLGYWALTKNQIAGIRVWVKEGAKNN